MAALFTASKFSATDADGNPLAGGRVWTYAAGTTTPKATYTTQAGTTANANPVVLDSTGRASIWLGSGAYKFVITDADGAAAPDGTVDNVFAAGGSAVINVRDFGAVGDNTADDTEAIQDAIDAAASYPVSDVIFPPGNYRTTATLTMPSTAGRNFGLIGQGNAAYGSVLSGVIITADHTAGPAILMQSSGQRIENIVVTASGTRTAGARGSNYGILIEPPDSSGAEIAGASLRNVTVASQPNHGVVTSGKLFLCLFDGLAVQNNKGHGLIVDCGAVTDRTNKDLPGGLVFNRLRAYGNTGHTVVVGLGNGSSTSSSSFSATIGASSFGAYRITMIDADLDCGGAVLDSGVGYGYNAGYNAIIKGDSISLQNVAFGCAQSGTATLVCAWLSGWAHKHLNCRYIQSTGVARIKATPSYDAYDFRFENPYLDVAVAVGIAGEDTGSAVARHVAWIGDKAMVTSVASTFDQVSDGDVYSNTYTPTLTNTTNLDASTAYVCQYMRVGSVVTVSGKVAMDPTATGNTILYLSLPVASDISDDVQVAGTFHGLGTTEPGVIYGEPTSNTAVLQHNAVGTGNRTFFFQFTYRVR